MAHQPLKRKDFLASVGKAGVCACAAAAGMRTAIAGQTAAPKPGDTSPARAAKRMEFVDGWLKRFFEAMDQTLDEPARERLMVANGRSCYAAYAGPPKEQPGPEAFEKFTAWVAKEGQKRGYAVDGRTISFEFIGSAETGQASPESVCLCPTAEAQKAGAFSPTYCLCSLGYVKEMHERMLGRPVEVALVDAVLRGGKRCRFRMTVA